MKINNAAKLRQVSPLSMYITMTGAMLHEHDDVHRKMQDMIAGIKRYQSSSFVAQKRNYAIIWRDGQTHLRKVQSSNNEADTILFIPSLVNKCDVFDLCTERSMAGWFNDQGYNVYILDWGDLLKERDIDLCGINKKFIGALHFLRQENNGRVHCLGYCMGGVLSLGALALEPNLADSLTLLATPWDFHAGHKTLYNRIQYWGPSALMQADKKQMLSAHSLQTLFASVDPLLAQKKFSRFLEFEEGSAAYNIFVAVEDWLNDGVDIPHTIAQDTIQNWYLNNNLAQKKWRINGALVDIAKIKIPVCVVASRKDRLVDFESSMAVKKEILAAHMIEPDCGHIGMIAGAKSIEDVWQPIENWLQSM